MSSKNDVRSETPLITRRRHVLACARCRARRVKCDRAQPACSNCVKVGALCQPVQTGGPSQSSGPSRVGSREPAEQNRLSKLEEQVARLSREVDSRSPSREPSHSPSPPHYAEDHPYIVQGRIVKGDRASTYISPYSWAAAAEEVIDIDSLIGEGFDEEVPQYGVTDEIMPLIDQQLHDTLLGVFGQRVDPFVHVLHWPSFLERYHEYCPRPSANTSPAAPVVPHFAGSYAAGAPYNSPQPMSYANPATLPSNSSTLQPGSSIASGCNTFLTLLYAVYYASLMSIIHSPNPPDLGPNNSTGTLFTALKREISTRMSRLDGRLARTESFETLQAMIIYISVEYGTADPQVQWLQLGTAIRMARSAGIHRDPSGFGFGPIEMESRRRLWAQICIIDARLADQLCREPTITPDSYDIILPLSISDHDLTEIDRQVNASSHGHLGNVQGLDVVEQEQQDISPFSMTTLMLIESEMARQQQQALCFRYQPRDLMSSPSSPELTRRAIPFAGRPGRTSWAGLLQDRYSSRYQLDHLSISNPMQYLVYEAGKINVMKASFISHLAQRKETSGPTSTPSGHSEALSIFQEALQLATRCAELDRQYSSSPYCWYVRRIRESSSCSFLALVLASELPISHEASTAAWAVLDQLFGVEDTVESGLQSSIVGKVLAKARVKRGLPEQAPLTQQYRDHTVPVGSAVYPMNMAQYHPNTFQSSGNIYEDWDSIMQESVWPGGVSAADQSYWPTQVAPASIQHTPSRPPSRPSDSRSSYPPPSLPLRSNAPPARYDLDHQIQLASALTVKAKIAEPYPSYKAPYAGAAVSKWSPPLGPQIIRTYTRDGGHIPVQSNVSLTHTTWPTTQSGSLDVPHTHARERSASQPPIVSILRNQSQGPPKRRSTSDFDERPAVSHDVPPISI